MKEINIKLLKNQKIRWVGTTDFPELYKYMKLWLEDNGYADERNLEKKYVERIKPEGKKQIEVKWHAEKEKGEFFTYNIDVTILVLGMSNVEVQEEGIKKKIQKGDFEMRVTSYLKSTKKWNELHGIQGLYYEMFIRKRIDVYLEEVYNKSSAFFSYIKSFLGLRD